MWDEITYPFLNFNSATVEVWEWISNFTPHFTGPCDYLSMLGLKLNHVSKRGTRYFYFKISFNPNHVEIKANIFMKLMQNDRHWVSIVAADEQHQRCLKEFPHVQELINLFLDQDEINSADNKTKIIFWDQNILIEYLSHIILEILLVAICHQFA